MGALRIKPGYFLLGLAVTSGVIDAQQSDSCAGLEGSALTTCRTARLEQLLQQQQERQNELDQQQKEVQHQLESMRLQNEALRKQLELEAANESARPVATASTAASKSQDLKSQDLKSWKADNPWFGTDYAKTQFAMRYAKQLQKDQPELTGRPLLDALSAKVHETFGAPR